MDAKTDNVITFFGGQQAAARTNPPTPAAAGREDYYACGVSLNEDGPGTETWFRIHGIFAGQDESIEMCRYADIQKLYSPAHGMVIIECTEDLYLLEGRYLTSVLLLIQDRRLRALYPFDPAYYREPDDEEEPIILRISRYGPQRV